MKNLIVLAWVVVAASGLSACSNADKTADAARSDHMGGNAVDQAAEMDVAATWSDFKLENSGFSVKVPATVQCIDVGQDSRGVGKKICAAESEHTLMTMTISSMPGNVNASRISQSLDRSSNQHDSGGSIFTNPFATKRDSKVVYDAGNKANYDVSDTSSINMHGEVSNVTSTKVGNFSATDYTLTNEQGDARSRMVINGRYLVEIGIIAKVAGDVAIAESERFVASLRYTQ